MRRAAQSQPARKPITEVREGIIISKLVFGKIFLLGGGTLPGGNVQGERTFSPGMTGVRMRA